MATQVFVKPVPALAAGAGKTVNTTSSETIHPRIVVTVKRKVAGEPVTVILLVADEGAAMVAAPETTLHTALLIASPGLGVAAPVTEKLPPHCD